VTPSRKTFQFTIFNSHNLSSNATSLFDKNFNHQIYLNVWLMVNLNNRFLKLEMAVAQPNFRGIILKNE